MTTMNHEGKEFDCPGCAWPDHQHGLHLVDITSIAKDGSERTVTRYRAVPYDLPRGNAVGYMPELNVLCAIGDFSPQSDQPLMKHSTVSVRRSG